VPLLALPVNLPSATVGHPRALTYTIFADPVRRLVVCLALVAIQTVRQKKLPQPSEGHPVFRIASIAGPDPGGQMQLAGSKDGGGVYVPFAGARGRGSPARRKCEPRGDGAARPRLHPGTASCGLR
jgi:hypothetical protein